MQYVMLDLEWNTVKAVSSAGFINEIIEIGAVKLDGELNIVDTFSSFIKPVIGKKLGWVVKKLTNISNDDLKTAHNFASVFSSFKKWLGGESTVIMSWGDGDIRALMDNFKHFRGSSRVPFLKLYADIQPYVKNRLSIAGSNQPGLNHAAEGLGIDMQEYSLHRALDDSLIGAECFRKTFDEKAFQPYIKKCDDEFYDRLSFKPYSIRNLDSPFIDKKDLACTCDKCGTDMVRQNNWKSGSGYNQAVFTCPRCGSSVRLSVKFIKKYDRVEKKRKVDPVLEDNSGQDVTGNETHSL